jgi:peroxiredoxin Q/BCP
MTVLEEGGKAPAFTVNDSDGNKVSLADFKGKKLILYFYPQDNTPTCTVQACNLRDNFSVLTESGFSVVGVSPDEDPSHKKFAAKFNLPFTLIADPEHKIIGKYGVWGEKQMYGKKYMGLLRTTFVIDEAGVILKIFRKPKSKEHAQEIMAAMQ